MIGCKQMHTYNYNSTTQTFGHQLRYGLHDLTVLPSPHSLATGCSSAEFGLTLEASSSLSSSQWP